MDQSRHMRTNKILSVLYVPTAYARPRKRAHRHGTYPLTNLQLFVLAIDLNCDLPVFALVPTYSCTFYN